MTFEELLTRLSDRVEADDDAVMDESVIVELERLRQLAQPSIPGRHTTEENIQIAVVDYAAGDLHLRRWGRLLQTGSHRAAAAELYQAFLAFRRLMDGRAGPPPWLPLEKMPSLVKQLFGSDPDAGVQGNVAYFLLASLFR